MSNAAQNLIDAVLQMKQTEETKTRSGMQTTNVPGFPLFMCWGRWGGTEANPSGNLKAFLLIPHITLPQAPLIKYNGASAIENPLDIVMGGVVNPYNCKVTVPPAMNVSKLVEGEIYPFTLALKPAAVGGSGKPTPYWDGYLKSFATSPNEAYKSVIALYHQTMKDWSDMKVTTNDSPPIDSSNGE